MEKDLFGVCPYVTAQKILTGKWTILILYLLSEGTMRFSQLHRALPMITQSTLTKQLRMMEQYGIIHRKVYGEVPPKVEYTLTELGKGFQPVLSQMEVWGEQCIQYVNDNGISAK